MDSSHDKKRINVDGDRLSNLPDDLIYKILSFLDITQAIGTSALSSRWRYIWASMPCLNFSSAEFGKLPAFSKFVTHVLSGRNNEIEVSSVKLAFRGKVTQVFVKRILDYAFSHNVQQLNVTFLHERKIEFPQSLFCSQSLKHLTLTGSNYVHAIMTPPIWELPALTTLNLIFVTLYDDNTTDKCAGIFSNCANLKNLTLKRCSTTGSNGLKIYHPGLSSLTLEDGCEDVIVVTPQLKNLTIIEWSGIHLVSAPDLASLRYKHYDYDRLKLSSDLLHLEKVDICIPRPSDDKEDAYIIVSLLQQLHTVKFLTLNSEILETLSSSVELISHLPSPFTNLKGLKIYPVYVTPEEETQSKVTMCTEVKNFLLDGSPGATFTEVSHEEIRALMNVASAQKLMKQLQAAVHWFKRKSVTDTTDMEQDKAPMERHMATRHEQVEVENHRAQPDTKMKWHFGERMARIQCFWEDLNKHMEVGKRDTLHIISRVQRIEEVLTKLPTSHRDRLQARFSGLCAEADTFMDYVMGRMKMQCNKMPSRSNVYFHELATSSHPSS